MKKKYLILGMTGLVAGTLLFSGCQGKNKEEAGTEKIVRNVNYEVSPDKSVKEGFYSLLQTETDSENLYRYVEENASRVKQDELDLMMNEIIGFEPEITNVDFNRLNRLSGKVTPEMKNFVLLMETEQRKPGAEHKQARIILPDLLERAYNFEEHMVRYGNGITYEYAFEKYCELMEAAIEGGYNGKEVGSHYFADQDKIHISSRAVDEYKDFINKHSQSETAKVLKSYLEILKENNQVVNKNIGKYYSVMNEVITTVMNDRKK